MNAKDLFRLEERDRLVYALRRTLKDLGLKYQFLHSPPEGSIGLVLREPWPTDWTKTVSTKLEGLGYSVINPLKLCRTFSEGQLSVTVVVHLCVALERPNLSGPVLLITTH